MKHVAGDDVDVPSPRSGTKAIGIAGQASDVPSPLEQAGNQPTSNVTAGSRK
jgi:hypothetical protein